MIRVKDGTSYLQINFSPKHLIERIVEIKIPAAVSVDSKTRSQKGIVAPWTQAEKPSKIKPIMYFLDRYGLALILAQRFFLS